LKVMEWSRFLEKGLELKDNFTAMTVGVFDGVHLGHQALLKRVVSHNADFIPAVVTFRSDYKKNGFGIGNRGSEFKSIQSFQERLDMFKSMGIRIVIVVDFNDEFRHLRGIEFLELLSKHGSLGFFAVGSGFRCGYRLDTDAKAIRCFFTERGIPAEITEDVCHIDSLPISSSRIRAAIAAGDTELAQKMLGW